MQSHDMSSQAGGKRARSDDRRGRPDRAPTDMVRTLQRVAGNAAVSALIQEQATGSTPASMLRPQTPGGPAVQRKPDVPGMSKTAETKAKPLLTGSAADKQKAVDLVFAELARNGRVPVPIAKLKGKKVHYDAGVSGEGLTTTDYSAKGKPKSCEVAIGDDAFASLPWLYSSVVHELKHAEQRLAVNLSKLPSSAMREAEAYAVEITRSGQTGVVKDPAKMEDLWTRLHDDHWVNITDVKEKKRIKAAVKRAHKIAEKATGKTLTFTP